MKLAATFPEDIAGTGSAVRITRVETIPLRVPLTTPLKIASGAARPAVEVLIVRLHTNEGIVGIGETRRGGVRAAPRRWRA